MFKSTTILVLLVVSTICLTDKEIMQLCYNGAFEQNKLPVPTTVVDCFDDSSAANIVVYMGELMQKLAKGSISDLINALHQGQQFYNSLPQPVKACLKNNEEMKSLCQKYGRCQFPFPSPYVQKKIITFITLNYPKIHKWFYDLNIQWKAEVYYQFGFDMANTFHQFLG